jgi:hypothetical protein
VVPVVLQGKLPDGFPANGDGYGYGYGYGSGDGSADGYYWQSCIAYFAAKWNERQQKRMNELTRDGAKIAFWRSNPDGSPANGGVKVETPAPGVIHTSPGPLDLCKKGTLHATLIPPKWKGERWWIVALKGQVVGDDEKYGALEREIIGEAI